MALWRAGVVIVASAGNKGPDPMTIGVPGDLPDVISVGALSDAVTPENSFDDYLVRAAGGADGEIPRHLYVFVVESLSSWPTLDEYRSFDLAPDLLRLGEKGVLVKHFLPASTSSMTSLSAIFTWPVGRNPQSWSTSVSIRCHSSMAANESGISGGARKRRLTPPALTPEACRPAVFFSSSSTLDLRSARLKAVAQP